MSTLRLHTLRFGTALLLGSGLSVAAAISTPATPQAPEGRFRVSRGLSAPWLEQALPAPALQAWIGRQVEFGTTRFSIPALPECNDARYETGLRPPEGLFQGGLPAPAAEAAARLGITRDTIASVTVNCELGLFDLHWATPDALMLAFDNVIWVLDRSPGALAPDGAPERTVQELLERHFGGDMGFTPETIAPQRGFLTASLQQAIDAYFAHPHPQDEPPPINGDPITDAQEYPVLFSVREASIDGARARVPVRYDDGHRSRLVHFVLAREAGAWHVDDLAYEYGGSLREALAERF